jgi:hypothetical protein
MLAIGEGIHVTCPLLSPDFNSICIVSTNVSKTYVYESSPKHVAQNTEHNTDDLPWSNTTITGTHSKILTNLNFLLIVTNQF